MLSLILTRSYTFDAQHRLPQSKHPEGNTIHSHTYTVTIIYQGQMDIETCWFKDHVDIDEIFMPYIKPLEGQFLNDMMPLAPTEEGIAIWLLVRLPEWVSAVKVSRIDSSAQVERQQLTQDCLQELEKRYGVVI